MVKRKMALIEELGVNGEAAQQDEEESDGARNLR
jgi:hypothetical protein